MIPRALIADDEPHLVADLQERLAAHWPELELLPPAPNGIEALRVLSEDAPDVAFLDIRMPGLTGIEIAQRAGGGTHIVFVTAYDQYAVEAFEREAVDYLLKPVTDERLARCVERLKRAIASAEAPAVGAVLERLASLLPGAGAARLRWVRALKGDEVRQIAVEDVLYFQAADKYTRVMARDGEFLIRTPLTELAAQLDPEAFRQIHRGTLVNLEEVAATRRDLGGRVFVRLKDGRTELAVSRAYAGLFRQM